VHRPLCQAPSPYTAAMKTAQIEPFFATLKAANPQPNTELEYTSVFELLAAVLLSRRPPTWA
jgi:endonuclease-3